MNLITDFLHTFGLTVRDVAPVLAMLLFFQLAVLRTRLAEWKRMAAGFAFVTVGLALFLNGLETALFPIGRIMAKQLSAPDFVFGTAAAPATARWAAYGWVYAFGALIGFATTVAEPALIAVTFKAQEVSRSSISQWGLRLAVAVGVSLGIGIGTFRIVTGTPLYIYIIAGYAVVVIQTVFAPREIVPLAYDSGGVTTSTVTVPLVAALGLGLAETVPGRDPLIDGFGLIAFASVFPMITVMAYAQLANWRVRRRTKAAKEE